MDSLTDKRGDHVHFKIFSLNILPEVKSNALEREYKSGNCQTDPYLYHL